MVLSTIFQQIQNHVESLGDKKALIFDGVEFSFQDFYQLVSRYRSNFTGLEGKAIALLVPNSVDVLALFVAGVSMNCNVQILNYDWPDPMVDRLIGEHKPALVISDRPIENCDHLMKIDELSGPMISRNISIMEDASLPFYTGFTSGSTGGPKGFVRSQQSWLDSFDADQDVFGLKPEDVIIAPGNLAHSLFIYAAIRSLYLGATVLIFSNFRPNRIRRMMEQHHASVIYATPTQLRSLMDCPQGEPLDSLRLILSSGSKFPVEWFLETKTHFPNNDLFEFYGSSELSYISTRQMTLETKSSNVGKPFPGVDVKIFSPEFTDMENYDIGQIYVKSKFCFLGYAMTSGSYDKGECMFHGDYLSVGDMGYMDAEGDLHLIGRVDRMFQSSGRNIYPEEIEDVLLGHPDITNVAVFGEENARKGAVVTAVLNGKNKIDLKSILLHCRQNLAPYAVPIRFYVIDVWPYTVSDKSDIQKIKLELKTGQLKLL